MIIASAALYAALTSDFLEAQMSSNISNEPVTVYAEKGEGAILAEFQSSGAYGSVPKGSTRIEMGMLNLSASCDKDVIVDSIRIQHRGLGDSSDISGIYLADGFRRISRSQQFDARTKTVTLRVPALVIPRCSAVNLAVLIDLSPDAVVAAEHAVTIQSPSDILSSAKETTLNLNTTPTTVRASPVSAGAVSLRFLPISSRLRYGRRETVARLQVSADAKNDYLLKAITLTNQETARDMDLIKFQITERDGTPVSLTAARMKARQVTLEFSPTYILPRSKTVVFLVQSEVRTQNYRKVNFSLEEPADFHVTMYRPKAR